MRKRYIFVDPFCKDTSGVSAYIKNSILNFPDLDYIPEVFSINEGEGVREFRVRLKEYVEKCDPSLIYIESPETLYATELISERYKIHIRLHGSREFGKLIQKLPLDKSNCKKEFHEIRRASVVSAPSLAALRSSEFLYEGNISAVIYPNPADVSHAKNHINRENKRDIDILFIGRWQNLKGIFYVNSIFNKFKNLNCVIASHSIDSIRKNLSSIAINSDAEKQSIYRRSKVVIIPSLFETASQVALEALVGGAKVVTWSHIGIREYVDHEIVSYAPPWDFEEFSRVTYDAVVNCGRPSNIDALLLKINKCFSDSVVYLMSENNIGKFYNSMPIVKEYGYDFISLYDDNGGCCMSDRGIIRSRKIKKLINNPYLFFRDAYKKKFPSLQMEKGSLVKPEGSPASTPAPVINKIKKDSEIENAIASSEFIHPNFLGYIGNYQKISLKDPCTKSKGWVTCIFYPAEHKDYSVVLGNRLSEFNDFSPFKSDRLNFIQYDNDVKISSFDLINKIDLKTKEKIGNIDFAIFINPDPVTLEAIRLCNENTRIISLYLRNSSIDNENAELICENTDAFLFFESCIYADFLYQNSRRSNSIDSYEKIPVFLRKIIQEIGPKKIDCLLPLINSDFDLDIINNDVRKYQGIVKLKDEDFHQGFSNNFSDYLHEFSSKVESLLVSESVYMRYRTLCEKIERGGSSAEFFEYALKDGFIFYVH
ncbi:glycosyl transferase family 1 [Comamonas sp. 26]|nr:glycosyl transferase family 1 [Comamonas sp. 26]